MKPFIFYILFVAIALVVVFVRSGIILLRGRTFLQFNLFFVLLILILSGIANSIPIFFLFFIAMIILINIILREKWFLLKGNSVSAGTILDASLKTILYPFRKTEEGYILESREGAVNIHLREFPGFVVLTIKGGLHIKKVEVLKNLLIKKFNRVIPRIIIYT